ncbi:lipopolysaccharide assembly protein LapB [Emticicia sp. BO119]|uniref:tetratricopeptide repeat protein n=1 Tax=Emticicia sp. BO119 TaxID=2757768 RepID=UPI0015F07A2D|nr:tetratricopeptide repeat protein [Emticicia sp. BO119]MBA4850828.1 tetratricopeptide repeat protein [Emticicia sp. BO119]
MKRHSLILIIIAVALTGFLYYRPKVVVKNEAKANRDKVADTKASATNNGKPDITTQAPKLSPEEEKQIADLKQKLAATSDKIAVFNEIAEAFAKANRFDSASVYVEKIALAQPTTDHWLRAGDAYYQAFTLALKPENVEYLAGKTRMAYQKVLEKSPRQLQAKTNLAMTYVQTDSPMQAIMMLRQVLEEEPNFEPALMNMGVLSMQSNQYAKAADRFRQVLRINPGNVNAQFGLGYSLLELGEKEQAKKILQDLKQKVKEPTLLEELNKTLESIK